MTTTVYIITPCMNAVATIDRTIMSVLSQAGDFRIRYHIQDGGSTDGTLERIQEWKQRLQSGAFVRQCQGIRFSFVSEQDTGMYDALVKGFSGLNASANDFMTWINADDILMPGVLSLTAALGQQFSSAQLSWFGGAVCNIKNDLITTSFDRPIPKDAIRLGLCEGVHWDYLQQEGTFFRKWLWNSVDPKNTVAPMKLAGDWNLWRLMASKASFAQVSFPLGGFRVSPQQLSARLREKYLAEIDSIISPTERLASFEKYLAAAPAIRRRIRNSGGNSFKILDESVDKFAQHRYNAVYKKYAPWAKRTQPTDREISAGSEVAVNPVDATIPEFPSIAPLVKKYPGIIALDSDWQFPAVTEKHAFLCMTQPNVNASDAALYVAYPWATLIDKVQNKAPDADLHLDRFEQFCDILPRGVKKVTVCQHIHGRLFLDYFRQAGIDTVFWSHATHDDVIQSRKGNSNPNLLPFPLFPVQIQESLPEAAPDADLLEKAYLYSFIGARANQYYLTEARNFILDLLKDDRRGLVIGRDSWHYQKVVYDLQVRGGSDPAAANSLVDGDASDQFRKSLLQSTFSLCPAGSGPNSIRLWESLGAGSIPVILADTWAPPGDPRLWENAVVFCKETPEAIKALPDRLAEIAADPEKLAQMRHAMRQIWLLYGPQSFVTDVQAFLLSHADRPATDAAGEGMARAMAEQEGAELLLTCAGELLLNPAVTRGRIAADPSLAAALRKAREALPDDAGLAKHYDAVSAHAARVVPQPAALARPAVQRKAAPKISFFGRHAKRTPLSYAPIRRLVGERLETVNTPEKADVLVTGFNIDLRENIETLQPLLKSAKKPKIAVLSEEPLWDITWSGPFTGRAGKISVKGVNIDYAFLGHETSDIYEFERIPYFVLTSETYAVRYANMMARFRTVSPQTLLDRWNRAPISAAFFAESRKGSAYANIFPERDVAGLSAYRTELAEAAEGPNVLRVGKGWGAEKPRQDLPDWHLDKLAQLDGRTRILSAVENVHQRLYISEKIFDAFAVGAVPVYWAGPKHRIFELVPQDSMLNCHGLTQKEAAARIAQFVPDADFAGTWLGTCARLAALFGDAQAIQKERQRVADATLEAILAVA